MDYTPLTPQELKQLDDLLKARDAMPLVPLHGFLTALASGPGVLTPSFWLAGVREDASLLSSASRQVGVNLIMRLYHSIAAHLHEGEPLMPLLSLESGRGDAEGHRREALRLWCQGYTHGVMIEKDRWFSFNAEEMALLSLPFMTLGDKEERAEQHLKEIMEDVNMEEMLAFSTEALPQVMLAIYDYWRAYEQAEQMFHSPAVKLGRNDPCPCGSGKKVKKCCGLQKLH